MAKLDRSGGIQGAETFSALCSLGIMFCLVVTVLGIKFKWFKHRLSFEQVPTSNGESSTTFRSTGSSSQPQYRQSVTVHGVFRQRFDEDIEIERPKSLPPIRIRKTSRGPPIMLPPKRAPPPRLNDETRIPPTPDVFPIKEQEPLFNNRTIPNRPKSEVNESNKVTNGKGNGGSKKSPNAQVHKTHKSEEKVEAQPRTQKKEKLGVSFDENITDNEKTGPTNDMLITRRPTGFVRPQIKDLNDEIDSKSPHKVSFQVEEFDENKEEYVRPIERRQTGFVRPQENELNNKAPEELVQNEETDQKPTPQKRSLTTSTPQPLELIYSQREPESPTKSESISIDDNDSWSAIQRHRNLTKELTKEVKELSLRRAAENGGEFRNPLARLGGEVSDQGPQKPRTMRDMKKNQSKDNFGLSLEDTFTEDSENLCAKDTDA